MNKRLFLSLAFIFWLLPSFPQIKKPIGGAVTYSKNEAKVGDIVELTISVIPLTGWHIFSEKSTCPADDGSVRGEVTFEPGNFELVGKAVGVGDVMEKDEAAMADCKVGVFHGKAVFKQRIKVKGPIDKIVASFNGQMCDQICVMIRDYKVFGPAIKVVEGTADPDPKKEENKEEKDTAKTVSGTDTTAKNDDTASIIGGTYRAKNESEVGKCVEKKFNGSSDYGDEGGSKSLWTWFIVALTSGFIALLTPCVFPMIPMTVSFFLKNTDKKKAIRDGLVFAVSIIIIYVLLGSVLSAFIGPDAANWLSTHWIPNLFFFIIFIVFAVSFFGAFELVLPSSWVNKMDQKADKGGWTGPIFMAVTIALVSFSCTGPIVGTVLVESAKGGFIIPAVAMFGFSLAFALPFGLLVIFPSFLQNLPKSGGWLNSVKVVLGFVELAFALKFLSTADQTYHWRLLDREIYLTLWIIIAILLGIYLLGKIKFAHDSDLKFVSVPRLFLIIASFSFALYMIPGLWGAPLKFLAGYLPPMSTQDFKLGEYDKEAGACGTPLYSESLHLPHGLSGYFDYDQAIECAKSQKKPLFVDFTGHGCVNCRKMEEKVWSDPAVLKKLKDSFIVVSLYVDDKKLKLPKSDYFIGKSSGNKITTLAEKNSEIQACYFNSNSQPMYALMNPAGETLLQPTTTAETFNYSSEEFAKFLTAGIKEYYKNK